MNDDKPDPSLIHIIMFAKYHYKTELSVREALNVIISERCGLSPINMNPQTIYNVLFQAMRQCSGLDWQRIFEDFITHFHCNNFWPIEDYNDNSHSARFNHLLSKIAFTETKDIKFHIDKDSRSDEIWRKLEEFRTAKLMEKWGGLGW